MKKNKLKIIGASCIILLILGSLLLKNKKEPIVSDLNVVASLESEITNDTIWCGTLNLLWNEMKNYFGEDLIFQSTPKIIEELNLKKFTKENLREEDYYLKSGRPTMELKNEIEREIWKKFKEKSDILDSFTWENHDEKDYFLYTMLKKNFEFPKVFDNLGKSKFKNQENVSYFGIQENQELNSQVIVLFYENASTFAVKLLTTGKDEVILARGLKGKSFLELYQELKEKTKKEIEYIKKDDSLKIPFMNFKVKKVFDELKGITFKTKKLEEYEIEKVIETIEFDLNEAGGKLKSEAGMMMNTTAMITPRNFHFNEDFVLFLKEKDASYPYFSMNISDITKVQGIE